MGACKVFVASFVDIIPIMKWCKMRVLSRLDSPFLTSRWLGALHRQVLVPRQAAAVAGMPGRDVVVKARR